MNRGNEPVTGFSVDHTHRAAVTAAIVGPLRGLVYILVLPFVGISACILLLGHWATSSLATMRRRTALTTAAEREATRIEAVGLRDLLRPLIDRVACQLVVVDREFRITQYHTPVSRRNELLEQTAVGRHCFEVSHGRNRPCESCDCECPVRIVLETNTNVTVTHYHEGQFEPKGVPRLVHVFASPVRDSEGNIAYVAQLIRDADDVSVACA